MIIFWFEQLYSNCNYIKLLSNYE